MSLRNETKEKKKTCYLQTKGKRAAKLGKGVVLVLWFLGGLLRGPVLARTGLHPDKLWG